MNVVLLSENKSIRSTEEFTCDAKGYESECLSHVYTIDNLPDHVLLKIVSHLSAEDYTEFRATCKKISHDCMSINEMKHRIRHGKYTGSLARHYCSRIELQLKNECLRTLSSDSGLAIFETEVKHVDTTMEYGVSINTRRFMPAVREPWAMSPTYFLFTRIANYCFRQYCVDNRMEDLAIRFVSQENSPQHNVFCLYDVSSVFISNDCDLNALVCFFSAVYHVFTLSSMSERLLLAVIMLKLKPVLCQHDFVHIGKTCIERLFHDAEKQFNHYLAVAKEILVPDELEKIKQTIRLNSHDA